MGTTNIYILRNIIYYLGGCDNMIKLVNGLHMNMYSPNTKWEFIPLSKREFNTILNKNRQNIISYIGHKRLATKLRVKFNRENTYTEIGDVLLVFCSNNRSKGTNNKPPQMIRYLILITGHGEYFSQKRLDMVKQQLMAGELA